MHLTRSTKLLPTIDVRSIVGIACLCTCLIASITTQASDLLHWKEVWVRSMPPGTQVTAAYGTLMNHSDETVTISQLTADVGSEAQMHDVIAEGDQRRMVQLKTADIAPGASLAFEPGGRHIMLIGVTEPLPEGAHIEICATSAAGAKACMQAVISRQAPGEDNTQGTHTDMHSGHHH